MTIRTAANSRTTTRACPKCGHVGDVTVSECPRCSVIIDKALRAEAEAAEAREGESSGWRQSLAAAERLSIKQRAELLESWTGFETANAYAVKDGLGNTVLHVAEEGGAVGDLVVRNYAKSRRPFTMRVESLHGDTAFVLERPFRLFFYEVEVKDPLGKPMGKVQRRFAMLNSLYTVTGRNPSEKYEILGPFFRPWTFKILRHGQECGLIVKSWGGLWREMQTDADAFGIEFPKGIGAELKAVFLGAVLLIDFAHFEDNNR